MTVDVQTPKSEVIYLSFILAKLRNTGPLIYILLNHNSAYSVPLCTSNVLTHVKQVALHSVVAPLFLMCLMPLNLFGQNSSL